MCSQLNNIDYNNNNVIMVSKLQQYIFKLNQCKYFKGKFKDFLVKNTK